MKIKLIIALVIAVFAISGGYLLVFKSKGQPVDTVAPGRSTVEAAPVIQLNVPEQSLIDSKDSKKLSVAIESSRYSSISRVDYLIDGRVAATGSRLPFGAALDISALAAGRHSLQAYAYDRAGNYSKSEVFSFEVAPAQPIAPADKKAQAIVRQSLPIVRLAKLASQAVVSTAAQQQSSSSGSGSSNGNGGGGSSSPVVSATPWPAAPPARICDNQAILGGGPLTAPAGSITVPAGDNSSFNFTAANTTYWFAAGTHHLGGGIYDQISPRDNTTFVGAPGAILDGQGLNNYAFTQHGVNVTIKYLTIQHFMAPRDEGVVNHDSGDGWTMEYLTVQNNGGGAVFVGNDGVLRYSCVRNNGQYGFQVYNNDPSGPSNAVLDHNEISGNNTDDWETQVPGCGCTGGGKFWDATAVTVTNNYVHDNHSVALWADTNDNDFLIENNYISDNEGQGVFYEISYNMIVRNNNFLRNAYDGVHNPGFPTGAIYISESGGDSRLPGRTANIEIYDNNFDDNWGGVILWENADRFCSSPANTSSGYCTDVNPAATLASCNDPAAGGSVNTAPYINDCRWKTQNVKVHDNIFAIDKQAIPNCAASNVCGQNGIFANSGSYPSWSPYMGSGIQNDIAFNQNNLFSHNTYLGDWQYMIKQQGTVRNFAIWQGAPNLQDSGSTYNGQPRYLVANAFDADTSNIEAGSGYWHDWFNAPVSRSTTEAHSGSASLRVAAADQFWGLEFSNPVGFAVTPADKQFSFWYKQGSGSPNVNVELLWQDENQNLLRTDGAVITPAAGWQRYAHNLTVPAGAASVAARMSTSSSANGQVVYFDDFVLEDK